MANMNKQSIILNYNPNINSDNAYNFSQAANQQLELSENTEVALYKAYLQRKAIVIPEDETIEFEFKNAIDRFQSENYNYYNPATFILNNQIVAIFDDGQEKEKQTLKKLDFTTILGPKLEVKSFVKNRILKLQIIILIAILVTIYGLFSALKRSRKNKNKIIVTKKGAFFYKKKRMHLGDLEHKIINLLLQSEKVIYTSDLLNIMDTPQFNYSHQTRILNDVLQKINDLYKTLSQQESNLIVTRKSSLDKRLKEYVIDKNIFVVK